MQVALLLLCGVLVSSTHMATALRQIPALELEPEEALICPDSELEAARSGVCSIVRVMIVLSIAL